MPSINSANNTHTATVAKFAARPRATILATSPAMTANASVRGDCYDVRDMYAACVQLKRTDTPLCDAVVNTYLKCSASEK
mmetsp:Transcript_2762/g.8127  ORF Transcript_2762/g.8127 Transcript_2762/m.8127 type:complete len:80 (+) Transcript_2762:146-385(+)